MLCRLYLLVVLALLCHASLEPLNYDRVRYIDTVNGHYIFRGNQPLLNGAFPYDTLRTYLSERAQQNNITLPSQYYLYDISLLNPNLADELPALQMEINFFTQNPTLGSIVNWPLLGDARGPLNYTASQRRSLAEHLQSWQPDQLPQKTGILRRLLRAGVPNDGNLPTVIYVHCGHGQDRTGEMIGTYQLEYTSTTFQKIWATNTGMGMDVEVNMNSLQWFCAYWAAVNNKNFNTFCALPPSEL